MKLIATSIAVVVGLLAFIAGFAAILALSAILNGYVLSILWGWFAVPTFGLPPLSIPAAIGLSLVVGYLTYQDTTSLAKKEGHKSWHVIVAAFVRPLVALGIGAVVHAFI